MTPAELGERVVALVGGATARLTYGGLTVDVPRETWVGAATAVRDGTEIACGFFDTLVAVDELDAGLSVVCRVWSVPHRHGLMLRTAVPAHDLRLASLTGTYAGAGWAEREAYEMFGLTFDGHPDLRPLLLPDSFAGHPLRKDFVLAARATTAWPGEQDPADRPVRRQRRRLRPPGVPDDGWGEQP